MSKKRRKRVSSERLSTEKRNIMIAFVVLAIAVISIFVAYQVKDRDVLSMNLREHKELVMHIHPTVQIDILGAPYPIPANIGISQEGMRVIHTHDYGGKLHIEAPIIHQFYLEDFFTIWGKRFDSECIFNYCADEDYELNVYVNGARSELYGKIPLFDADTIRIRYTKK